MKVAPQDVDKGPSLERWVPINVFFSLVASVVFVGLGLKSIFDRNVPGVHTSGWLYLAIGMCALDGLLFFFMALLSTRRYRKEIRRNNQWYAYPDTWYHTHRRVALTAFLLSAFTLVGIALFYHNYGGEDPYDWPSAYNVPQFEKPGIWNVIIAFSCLGRLMMLTDKYLTVYETLADPGLIQRPPPTAATAAVPTPSLPHV